MMQLETKISKPLATKRLFALLRIDAGFGMGEALNTANKLVKLFARDVTAPDQGKPQKLPSKINKIIESSEILIEEYPEDTVDMKGVDEQMCDGGWRIMSYENEMMSAVKNEGVYDNDYEFYENGEVG